jgi:hypothetical protein
VGQRPKHIKKSTYFPRLNKKNHSVESDRDGGYNCIAFAAGITTIKWWPIFHKDAYWPADVPYSETVDAFVRAFGTLGYVECQDGSFVLGVEKIAIYSRDGTRAGRPTHAARQVDEKSWASKLGNDYDIHHRERVVSGGGYGEIAVFMQRPRSSD